MSRIRTALNWSSGKDAALAYHLLQQGNDYEVVQLLTTVNTESDRVVMHGVREVLLDAQANAMGMPLQKIVLPSAPDDEVYKKVMAEALDKLKVQGITTSAFGDIFLEDLKLYREQQLASAGFTGVFPLWKRDTSELVQLVEDTGIKAMIVCVNEKFLGKEFLGRTIDRAFLQDLPAGVDACGENGEFHTFVYEAPYFKQPIAITKGEVVYKNYTPAKDDKDKWNTGFYFLDLLPAL